MSKLAKSVTATTNNATKKAVTNYMGGISFEVNPLDTLKMMSASSIFGEPQYYRDGEFADATVKTDPLFKVYSILTGFDGKKTSAAMEEAIDKALDYDFEGTIEWAATLRKDYYMRLNPQVIMVRAAKHPKRQSYNEQHPGKFSDLMQQVMQRADEPAEQLAYYLFAFGNNNKGKDKKKEIPGFLKRAWAKRIERMTALEAHKYKNGGVGLINTVRICHATSPVVVELMRTGNVAVEESKETWEVLRSSGKSWREILETTRLGHMALLRNLRNIFTEIEDYELATKLMEQLKGGVLKGKQFPFRYYNAYRMIQKADVHHQQLILDTLEECIDISCENQPKLKGKTMCLSDNSGSAWGTFNSEFGTMTIASIDNLSSVITARGSDEGYVGIFGDRLEIVPVSKREGVLSQAKHMDSFKDRIGMSTENGVWLFLDKAIRNKEHWDNIVIYSDMQAGHGGLYGRYCVNRRYIDVAKLVARYRQEVNPKVNVFCVQTAGYDNIVLPEYGYRTNLLYGWTGKELQFIDIMNRFWDEKDKEKEQKREEKAS